MKKAMLFFVALFFSVAANAATITVEEFFASPNTAVQTAFGNLGVGVGENTWASIFKVTTDADTDALIEWTFTPETAVISGLVGFTNLGVSSETFAVTGNFSKTVALLASGNYFIGFTKVVSAPVVHSLEVSAVPVPAAAFLFAPALVGFMALRRKAAKAA